MTKTLVDILGIHHTPDLLTPARAAEILGVSRRRVAAFIADGRLVAHNIGGVGRGARWVVWRTEVERVAEEERRGGRPLKNRD